MKKATLLILSIAIIQFGFSQIIYTDIIPDDTLVPDYTADSRTIDFNDDFTPELIIFSSKQDTAIQTFPVTISGIVISTMGNTEIIAQITTLGNEDVVVADTLTHGDVISSSASYMSSNTPSVFPGVGLGIYAESGFGNFQAGNFIDNGNLFFGVKFEIGANIHYGWVQVKVAADASSGIIYDFAYQSIADSSIFAGNVEDGFVSVSNDNLEEVVIYAANKKLHLLTGNESGNLAIYNLLGKQLINTQINGNTNFDINDLSKGIYLVTFTNGLNTITKKVYIE
jgi:hypothetical protein